MSVYVNNKDLRIVWLIISIAIAVVLVIASYFLAVKSPDSEKVSVYECGLKPYSDARENFEVRYFLVAILFIFFFLSEYNHVILMSYFNVLLFEEGWLGIKVSFFLFLCIWTHDFLPRIRLSNLMYLEWKLFLPTWTMLAVEYFLFLAIAVIPAYAFTLLTCIYINSISLFSIFSFS